MRLYVKWQLILSYFNDTGIFYTYFLKNTQISNFIKIRPTGADLLDADGRTKMTKLTVTFLHFSNAPKTSNIQRKIRRP